MTSALAKFGRSKLCLGFVVPLCVEIAGALLICTTESGAHAAGFAALAVLLMLLIAIPATVLGNILILSKPELTPAAWLKRGMVLPTVFLAAAVLYYSGVWDQKISVYLPTPAEKISSAGSQYLDEKTFEAFFVIRNLSASSEMEGKIEGHAGKTYLGLTGVDPDFLLMNVYFYYVPAEFYDPTDTALSRKHAIASYLHSESEDSAVMERMQPRGAGR